MRVTGNSTESSATPWGPPLEPRVTAHSRPEAATAVGPRSPARRRRVTLHGLVASIVGCFLLANSILFRHPRTLLADYFGSRRRLSSIREYIFHRVQIHLGFLFLLELDPEQFPAAEALALRQFPDAEITAEQDLSHRDRIMVVNRP